MKVYFIPILFLLVFAACKKQDTIPQPGAPFNINNIKINDSSFIHSTIYNVGITPRINVSFNAPVNRISVSANVTMSASTGMNIPLNYNYENNDNLLVISTQSALNHITSYTLTISEQLKNRKDSALHQDMNVTFITAIDSTDKFPRISDSALLTLVEEQTFKYFWDFGHPVSGMARERNTSGDVCTTGGTGFGIMAMLVAMNRSFISRSDGLNRIQKIVTFLQNKCTTYHGAFSHWVNGATGATVPFSTEDDGADLVETSYLMMGLLCARQYFNENNVSEDTLRNDINDLWNGVEWNFFAPPSSGGGQGEALYWHWSPNYGWENNLTISGWNEALITYVLAASANKDSISKSVYDNGWARNGAMKNGKQFFGITLPLGPDYGGPLFFSQYSFLGLNPHGLSDTYANYWTQDTAQAMINYLYCVNNPQNYNGYSNLCWGLTASDDNNGYSAHSPTNDDGVISPTAAISSLPYTPVESMNALKFFYYTLGDKIWGEYGFKDAFNLSNVWFANSYLAIDQAPEMIMIENYRSGLLWNLFMNCPEIQRGLGRLGFTVK
ncbi:MAG: beta-glucosidase [Chitinophagaceae bacterium]|nr:MAG: beta-glucosidase [Chitinophagaceae bacterium]